MNGAETFVHGTDEKIIEKVRQAQLLATSDATTAARDARLEAIAVSETSASGEPAEPASAGESTTEMKPVAGGIPPKAQVIIALLAT